MGADLSPHLPVPAPGAAVSCWGFRPSVSGPGGGELAQPRVQPTRDQDQVLLELGGGHSPQVGWGGVGRWTPTSSPVEPLLIGADTPCLHFYPTSPWGPSGAGCPPWLWKEGLCSLPLDPHSNVGLAAFPGPEARTGRGGRPPRDGLTALLRPAQCPMTSVL